MIKIDFYNLINSYENNLLDNLRGFGVDKDYLKFWVPGTDNLKSFLNLIDALYESEEYEFFINLKTQIFSEDFIDKILFYLDKIGHVKKEKEKDSFVLKVKLNKKINNLSNYQKIKKSHKIETNLLDKFLPFKSQKKIEDLYLENLNKIKFNNYFSKNLNKNDKDFFFIIEGYILSFEIENTIVTRLRHNCKDYPLNNLINVYFDICIKKNIQEIAEHSVIYLEEKIRLINRMNIKKGIILPHHAGTYFETLNKLARNIYENYKKKTSSNFGINKNYYKKSYDWINLPENDKFKKVNNILEIIKKNNLIEDKSLSIKSIDNSFKIYLSIDKEFIKLQNNKNILLEIEIMLKELDNLLEVFVEEALDKNKIRIKNSPQTKLLN